MGGVFYGKGFIDNKIYVLFGIFVYDVFIVCVCDIFRECVGDVFVFLCGF